MPTKRYDKRHTVKLPNYNWISWYEEADCKEAINLVRVPSAEVEILSPNFYGSHLELVYRHGINISHRTTNMF